MTVPCLEAPGNLRNLCSMFRFHVCLATVVEQISPCLQFYGVRCVQIMRLMNYEVDPGRTDGQKFQVRIVCFMS